MLQTTFDGRVFRIALSATLVVMAIGAAWYSIRSRDLPAPAPPAPTAASEEVFDPVTGVNRMHTFPSASVPMQASVHRLTLAMLALLGTLGFLFFRCGVAWSPTRLQRYVGLAVYLFGVLTTVWLLVRHGRGSTAEYCVGATIVALQFLATKMFSCPRLNRTVGLVACGALALWCVPGLFIRFDNSKSPWYVDEIRERHLVAIVSYGDRLAQGLRLYEDVRPSYSGLMAIPMAAWVRSFGVLSWRGDAIFVEAVQIAYVAMACWCYYLYSGRRWIIALPALAFLVSPCSFASHVFNGTPNHTAWRTIMFSVALVSVFATHRLSPRIRHTVSGFVAYCSVLQNIESGMAILAGLGCLVAIDSVGRTGFGGFRNVIIPWAEFLLGIVAAMLGYGLLCLVTLGYWVDFRAFFAYFVISIRAMSQGFSGGSFHTLDPLAAVFFGHAAWVVLATAMKSGRRGVLDLRGSARLFAAVTMLVWFAYYANRPDPEYLVSYYVLYGVLLIDLLRTIADARRYRGAVCEAAVVAAFLLVVTVVPQVCKNLQAQLPEYREGWKRILADSAPTGAVELSGIWLPDDRIGAALVSKADYIRRRAEQGPVAYFTENGYLIPKLSGVWPTSPMAEPFWECNNRASFDGLVHAMVESQHQDLFFDAPESLEQTDAHPAQFYRYLKRALSDQFEFVESTHGWEHWRRK